MAYSDYLSPHQFAGKHRAQVTKPARIVGGPEQKFTEVAATRKTNVPYYYLGKHRKPRTSG